MRILAVVALFAQVISGPGAGIGPGPGAPPPVAAATPVEGIGAISGVVVDAISKAPLAGASVQLASGTGNASIQLRQLTDAKGRFAFPNLPPGTTYAISAGLFGYLDGAYGRDPGVTTSVPIPLRENEWLQDVRVQLGRPGTIIGTVLDERGEPVVGAFVRTLARARLNGRERLMAGTFTLTDDRGMYRITGLLPGRYLVEVPTVQSSVPLASQPGDGRGGGPAVVGSTEPSLDAAGSRLLLRDYPVAVPDKNRIVVYPPTFFPGSRIVSGASAIDLRIGEERSGVDITLEPVTAWRVSGSIQGPPESMTNLTLRLLPEGLEALGNGSETATALVSSDGRFTFLNVPDGSYTLDAPRSVTEFFNSQTYGPSLSVGRSSGPGGFPIPPSRQGGWGMNSLSLDSGPAGASLSTVSYRGTPPNYFGRTPVTVSGRDEDNVIVRMQQTGTLRGTVASDIDASKPTPTAGLVGGLRLEPATSDASLGRLQVQGPYPPGAGEFEIQGVLPGQYFLRGGVSGWTVKSITWRGRDFTDRPFDAAETPDISDVQVTLTNAAPTLSGTVRSTQGTPAESAFVVIFPADRTMWANYGFSPTRIRSTSAGRNGTFRLTGLPAGDYLVLALDGSRPNWHEPEFMQAAEAVASRVTLTWAQTATLDLAVAQVR